VIEAVLFDWDGTLCDSAAAGYRAFTKSLAEFGVEFSHQQYRDVYTPAWYRMYEAFGLPASCWKDADRRWLHHYSQESPELIRGAAAVLEGLRRRGIRTGIVTSGTRGRIDGELARLGLEQVFHTVVCHEDVARKKPHPEGLERAIQTLGASTAASCFVGDTPEDIEMGKSAGVFTAAVVSDYVDGRRLAECRPDVLLQSIDELPGALSLVNPSQSA
jgi:HAD superfamily hydrolase (TIGR01509 family)